MVFLLNFTESVWYSLSIKLLLRAVLCSESRAGCRTVGKVLHVRHFILCVCCSCVIDLTPRPRRTASKTHTFYGCTIPPSESIPHVHGYILCIVFYTNSASHIWYLWKPMDRHENLKYSVVGLKKARWRQKYIWTITPYKAHCMMRRGLCMHCWSLMDNKSWFRFYFKILTYLTVLNKQA